MKVDSLGKRKNIAPCPYTINTPLHDHDLYNQNFYVHKKWTEIPKFYFESAYQLLHTVVLRTGLQSNQPTMLRVTTIFLLMNATRTLQIQSPVNGISETKDWAIMYCPFFVAGMPFLMDICLLDKKTEKGCLLDKGSFLEEIW